MNGDLLPYSEARIPVEDRGFNFSDGIYEMVRVVGGRAFRIEAHLDRFANGARVLQIEPPLARDELRAAILDTARANEIAEGTVYVQLTRGAAPRRHAFPAEVRPTLVMLARPFAGRSDEERAKGVAAVSAPDLRWGYCEVKTIGLLPNVLANQHAHSRGCYEAILVRDGIVTEGAHSSVFSAQAGVVRTHPVENILPGITRMYLIDALRAEGVQVEEVGVPLEEFRQADEIFLTGTATEVLPVVRLDGEPLGDGVTGELSRLAARLYFRDVEAVRAAAEIE